MQRSMTVVPAALEVEAVELLEPMSLREIVENPMSKDKQLI